MRRVLSFAVLAAITSSGACQKVDRSAPPPAAPPSAEVFVTKSGAEMVRIPAGRFVMGRDDGPPEQGPAHEVELDAFYIDRYEVTQAVYAKMDPVNGSHFKGPDLPTEMIGWGKAALYCNMRSEAEGFKPCYNEYGECDFEADGYRLPTEAEWEYACRAGSDSAYDFGSDAGRLGEHAWFAGNANKKTHPVGRKSPNAWGLYDMHGNVAEWCNDFYAPDYYAESPAENPRGPAEGEKNVLRGGHWGASSESCTSAFRIGEEPGFSDACFARDAIGFRCVRKAAAETPAEGAPQQPLSASTPPHNLRVKQSSCPTTTDLVSKSTSARIEPNNAILAESREQRRGTGTLRRSTGDSSLFDVCMRAPDANDCNRVLPRLKQRIVRDATGRENGGQEGRGGGVLRGAPGMPLSSLTILASVVRAQPEKTKLAGFVYDDVYLRHLTGSGHPERPERLQAIVDRLQAAGLLEKLRRIKPRPAEEKWLTAVHTPEHIAALRQLYAEGNRFAGSRDTPISESSYDVALVAVGGVLAAVDAVMAGEVRNAFCAVRPPGHHATPDRAMGFCLLNNVAIAARYVQQQHKLGKVLIVDWDVHHGNGTQDIFYKDPSVFYFGVHQHPFYPGTGSADERGEGDGKGFTLNVPLPAGSGDAEFQQAFTQKLVPAAREFRPDFVLISAGFDAHKDDLLGRMQVTTEGFAQLTSIVKQIAEEHCHGRLVSVLEGGYDLDGLAASVEAHVRTLSSAWN
ncbi:MAG: SUMF1/EgtB/PvdO family nonheme iron enzyme [Planctomycetaceae bacterium]|nr:SUMF1/EgtB/PvdO family nonheme iron enzyme [Planctomycetaceae bacterium]